MEKEIAIVIYPHGSNWYWRIEVDGKIVEDCTTAYGTLTAAVSDARKTHMQIMIENGG